jgi:hypothetical protein
MAGKENGLVSSLVRVLLPCKAGFRQRRSEAAFYFGIYQPSL